MMDEKDPRYIFARLTGERDGLAHRAIELAGEVRRTTVSMRTAQASAEASSKKISDLRALLQDVIDQPMTPELMERIRAEAARPVGAAPEIIARVYGPHANGKEG